MPISWKAKYTASFWVMLIGALGMLGGFAGYVYYGGIESVTAYAAYVDYWYAVIGVGLLLFFLGAFFNYPRRIGHRFRY